MVEIGAQLYTIRDFTQNPKDFRRSMKKISEIGYKTVQISGAGASVTAPVAREICDEFGLSIVLTHNDVNRILHDTEALIRDHEIMGCKYIGLGSMPKKYEDPEWIGYFAEDFREPVRMIRDAGMKFMYHNHNLDFVRANGKYLLDYLLDSFGPDELGVTLDTYWLQAAGVDTVEWIEKLSDRIPCVHLKDYSVNRNHEVKWDVVMEGNMNFPRILAALDKTCCEYALVEQDSCEESPFVCLKRSFDHLMSIR